MPERGINNVKYRFYLMMLIFILCWEKKEPELWARDCKRSKQQHIFAFVVLLVLPEYFKHALPFQSWSSKFNPCPHMKTRWNSVCQFYFIIYLFSCLKAKS